MGLLRGGLTVRRFRAVGDVPTDWRERYRDALQGLAFREPPGRGAKGGEELEGWVLVHNLLDTDFSDFNTWLYDPMVVFALRVDKKTLPAKLVNATVEVRVRKWCAERGVERCPGSVKREIKEALEAEWYERALPRVQTTEVCWNLDEGWVIVGSTSEKVTDRIRKRFHRTFALELHPWSPLDALADVGLREALMGTSPVLGGEA